MALRPNATLTFTGYTVVDTGLDLTFLCADPGPGEASEYTIHLTDADPDARPDEDDDSTANLYAEGSRTLI